MKKRVNKGFTLIELLVVIAILAVLATVAIVGYTAFTRKANNSNALTELKQTVDAVMSSVISATGEADDSVDCAGVTFKYDSKLGKVVFDDGIDSLPVDSRINITNAMTKVFKDLSNVDGYYIYAKSGKIYHVTTNKKGIALWESGKDPVVVDIKVDTEIEDIDFDYSGEDDDEPEVDENLATVYFHLYSSSSNLGNIPKFIQVKKGSNVMLNPRYIEHDGIATVVAGSNCIAIYHLNDPYDVEQSNGIFGLSNVTENMHIYIEFR